MKISILVFIIALRVINFKRFNANDMTGVIRFRENAGILYLILSSGVLFAVAVGNYISIFFPDSADDWRRFMNFRASFAFVWPISLLFSEQFSLFRWTKLLD